MVGAPRHEVARACDICADEQLSWNTFRLPCGHGWYCASCTRRHAEARLAVGAHEVPCPECGAELPQALLRTILPAETMERLLERSLERAVGASGNLWPCPSPGCPNRVALEEGQVPRLDCSFCHKERRAVAYQRSAVVCDAGGLAEAETCQGA